MSKFKVGDRVKQGQASLSKSESPFAIITRIDGEKIYHRHENSQSEYHAPESCFEPVLREEVIYE